MTAEESPTPLARAGRTATRWLLNGLFTCLFFGLPFGIPWLLILLVFENHPIDSNAARFVATFPVALIGFAAGGWLLLKSAAVISMVKEFLIPESNSQKDVDVDA